MKRIPHFSSVLLIIISGACTRPPEPVSFSYPPNIPIEELARWLDRAPKEHPRLLATMTDLENLKPLAERDETARMLAGSILAEANYMLVIPPVERRLVGRRLLGQSRTCLKRVLTLATAFHFSGDRRFALRAEEEMLAAARFQDWNPNHFLDTAEMTCALALGYDWLYHELKPPSRDEIREAIIEKGLVLPLNSSHNGWVMATNNWGQVCHGGLTAGALAIMEDEPDLAVRTVHSALKNVPYSMEAYAPVGSYPEGPGYWAYGTSFNVLLIALLESTLGSDFGLSKASGFDQTGGFPALMTGPTGEYFNYADGGSSRSPSSALYWFAKRYDRPDWLSGESDRIRAAAEKVDSESASGQSGRLLPLALLWMPAASASGIQLPLHWNGGGKTPVTVHRSSWTDPNRTFVGVKAGSPSANHGNMDIGSFVLDADGVRWALDLGAENYHGIESRNMNLWNMQQDSDRWTIFRQQNQGHNTLVIDGRLQVAGGRGEITHFSADREFPHTIVDMSEVYASQADKVLRGVALLPSREVLVQDHLTGLKPGSRVRWGMITPGRPSAGSRAGVELTQGEKSLSMRVLSPGNSKWQVVDTARPRNDWDSPNPGTCMVAFEALASGSGVLDLAVLLTPGSVDASVLNSLELRTLESWRAE